jgi:hypothetical protein
MKNGYGHFMLMTLVYSSTCGLFYVRALGTNYKCKLFGDEDKVSHVKKENKYA